MVQQVRSLTDQGEHLTGDSSIHRTSQARAGLFQFLDRFSESFPALADLIRQGAAEFRGTIAFFLGDQCPFLAARQQQVYSHVDHP